MTVIGNFKIHTNTMKKTRLFLTILPKFFWIVLMFGVSFRFIGGEYYILCNSIIYFLLIYIFIKVGIVIHEIGHLVFAEILGGEPRRLELGKGQEIFRFELAKIKVIINSLFCCGASFAIFPNQKLLKIKYLFFVSGGILFNIFFAYPIYLFNGLNLDFLSGEFGVDIGSAFVISNVYLIIFSIIPYKVTYNGIKIANDGLTILKLPFRNREKIYKEICTSELFDAFDYYEAKEYDKAIDIYERYLRFDEVQTRIKIDLGLMYLKKGNYFKALELSIETIDSLKNKEDKKYQAVVYNNIAWIYLIIRDIENADTYSEKAYNIVPSEKSFQGTRGSVLIEKGEIDVGIRMLSNLVDFKFVNSQTISSSMYLGYGFFLKGEHKEQKKYMDFVENNINKLDIDEKKLLENIKLEIKEKVSTTRYS